MVMRAAHVTELGDPEEALTIVDVDRPEPDADEVRLQVTACALNRLDIFARLGHPDEADEFPKQTGGDIAGVVDAVGAEVRE